MIRPQHSTEARLCLCHVFVTADKASIPNTSEYRFKAPACERGQAPFSLIGIVAFDREREMKRPG